MVYWSYNTNFKNTGVATNGSLRRLLSSIDGSKVAFVETRSMSTADRFPSAEVARRRRWRHQIRPPPDGRHRWTADGSRGTLPGQLVLHDQPGVQRRRRGGHRIFAPLRYARDAMYSGTTVELLHKFINVFVSIATPSEVVTAIGELPWTRLHFELIYVDTVSASFHGRRRMADLSCTPSGKPLALRGTCAAGGAFLALAYENISCVTPHSRCPDRRFEDWESLRAFSERWYERARNSVGYHVERERHGRAWNRTVHHLHSGAFADT